MKIQYLFMLIFYINTHRILKLEDVKDICMTREDL